MILPMYIFGQPVLRKVAEEINFESYPNLKELISNMFETLERSECVGLAAPQVGLPIRLFIIDLDAISEDEPQDKGYRHTFINPEIPALIWNTSPASLFNANLRRFSGWADSSA